MKKFKITSKPGSVYPSFFAALTTWLSGFPSSTSLITYPNVPVIDMLGKSKQYTYINNNHREI